MNCFLFKLNGTTYHGNLKNEYNQLVYTYLSDDITNNKDVLFQIPYIVN